MEQTFNILSNEQILFKLVPSKFIKTAFQQEVVKLWVHLEFN